MSDFQSVFVTHKGIALIQKLQANQANTNFTRAATGDGDYTQDEYLLNKINLKNERQTFAFNSTEIINESTIRLNFTVANKVGEQVLTEGYYVKEVGIFALDPDEGEILYAIAVNEPDRWDYLPPYNNSSQSTINMSLKICVSNAEKIEIKIDNNNYVTIEDVINILKDKIEEHNLDEAAHPFILNLIKKLKEDVTNITDEQLQAIYEYLLSLGIENIEGIGKGLREHIETFVTAPNGVHGIRYIEDKLQVEVDGEWVDVIKPGTGTGGTGTGGTGTNPPGGTGTGGTNTNPPGNIKNLKLIPDIHKMKLTWQDPDDTGTYGKWIGTKVVMSSTGFPQSINDGTLIVDNKTRNAYQNNALVVSNLDYGKDYYFSLFPYAAEDVINNNTSNRICGTPHGYLAGKCPGVIIDAGARSITLLWADPEDSETVKWKSTHIIMKQGSLPQSMTDGQKVIVNTERNKYNHSLAEINQKGFKIENLEANKTYYFVKYTESIDGITEKQVTENFKATPLGLSAGECTWLECAAGTNSVSLRWQDPEDIEGVQEWEKTILSYKENSIPEVTDDDVTTMRIYERNSYRNQPLVIYNLTPGIKYYFRLFTNNDDNTFTPSAYRTAIPIAPVNYKTYTVNINLSTPNPSAACSYVGSVDYSVGSTDWANWFGIYPVLLKNGQEIKRLSFNNYGLDSAGNVVNPGVYADGDVMIAFPRRGIKIEKISTYQLRVSITDDPNKDGYTYLAHTKDGINKDVFYLGAYLNGIQNGYLASVPNLSIVTNYTPDNLDYLAQQRGNGYSIASYSQLVYLQVLYIMMFRTLQITTYRYGSTSSVTGTTAKHGLFNNGMSNIYQIKCFGLEDLWGNFRQYWSGYSSTAGSGYVTVNNKQTGVMIGDISGYVSNVSASSEAGFLGYETNGSSTTYLCAYQSTAPGTSCMTQDAEGLFALVTYLTLWGDSTIGSRLMYL